MAWLGVSWAPTGALIVAGISAVVSGLAHRRAGKALKASVLSATTAREALDRQGALKELRIGRTETRGLPVLHISVINGPNDLVIDRVSVFFRMEWPGNWWWQGPAVEFVGQWGELTRQWAADGPQLPATLGANRKLMWKLHVPPVPAPQRVLRVRVEIEAESGDKKSSEWQFLSGAGEMPAQLLGKRARGTIERTGFGSPSVPDQIHLIRMPGAQKELTAWYSDARAMDR